MKRKSAVIIGILCSFGLNAQDAEFSQFYASPIYTNPGLAGVGLCGGRVVTNYRNQWPSLPGTFRTLSASYDQATPSVNGAFGVIAFNDVAGDGLLTTTSVSGIYAYQTKLSRSGWFLSSAMQASYVQRTVDFNKLRWADQIEPKKGFINPTKEAFPNTSVSFSNFSAGAVVYNQKFFAGFAVHNITEPFQSFYGSNEAGTELPRRFTLHSGMEISLLNRRNRDADIILSPNILIMVQRRFTQANFGFSLTKGPLTTGLWFRQTGSNSDALIALLGFRHQDFRVAYSYDFTVSSARIAAPGSHEISVGYSFCRRKPIRNPTTRRDCPDLLR